MCVYCIVNLVFWDANCSRLCNGTLAVSLGGYAGCANPNQELEHRIEPVTARVRGTLSCSALALPAEFRTEQARPTLFKFDWFSVSSSPVVTITVGMETNKSKVLLGPAAPCCLPLPLLLSLPHSLAYFLSATACTTPLPLRKHLLFPHSSLLTQRPLAPTLGCWLSQAQAGTRISLIRSRWINCRPGPGAVTYSCRRGIFDVSAWRTLGLGPAPGGSPGQARPQRRRAAC